MLMYLLEALINHVMFFYFLLFNILGDSSDEEGLGIPTTNAGDSPLIIGERTELNSVPSHVFLTNVELHA